MVEGEVGLEDFFLLPFGVCDISNELKYGARYIHISSECSMGIEQI